MFQDLRFFFGFREWCEFFDDQRPVVETSFFVRVAASRISFQSVSAFRHFFIQTWNCLNPESALDSVVMFTPSHVARSVAAVSLIPRSSSLRIRSSSGSARRHAAIQCFSSSVGILITGCLVESQVLGGRTGA